MMRITNLDLEKSVSESSIYEYFELNEPTRKKEKKKEKILRRKVGEKGLTSCRIEDQDRLQGVAIESGELHGPEGLLGLCQLGGQDSEVVSFLQEVAVVEVVLVAEEFLRKSKEEQQKKG